MYRIAVVPGDGIGKEVVAEGIKVLQAAADVENITLQLDYMDLGSDRYLDTGELLTDEDIKFLRDRKAVYFGAIGDPRVAPGVLEKGILIKMRTTFDQYINLRPSKAWHPYTPLKGEKNFDILFLRENTEDFYMGAGGILDGKEATANMSLKRRLYDVNLSLSSKASSNQEFAFEIGMMSRKGIERFADYCFETAKRLGEEKVTAVDKANVCTSLYGLWREVFNERSKHHEIDVEYMYVDAMAMALIRSPERFGVVACPNMFGDILTDIGAEIMGGLGVAASGNICPDGVSMFEPVHGSAPDIAGQGKANPIAAILAGKLMMDQLGRPDIGNMIEFAVRMAMKQKLVTADMGGTLNTVQAGDAIAKIVRSTG
ncbi:MAG: isocitrate/isopropylmalate dehydrogenase family protein [Euryarchaeota archaeon]|nr:isocitrate/isopropylmalate dehydrogenase family protein [Euryarchaeota archaeon]